MLKKIKLFQEKKRTKETFFKEHSIKYYCVQFMSHALRTMILCGWQASRYHFVTPSLFPAAIGSIVSWSSLNLFSVYYFILVIIGVSINHIALNMTDDYIDYKHAVDNKKPGKKNPYTGGSVTLTKWSYSSTENVYCSQFPLCRGYRIGNVSSV